MVAAVTVRKNGKAEMAYVGEKPWHGLGQALTKGASIDAWAVESGMDWKAQRAKVRFPTTAEGAAAQQFAEWPSKHVIFRSDSKAPVGLVSDGFKIVQPRAVLEFFRDMTEKQGMSLETAGTLFGGSRFWALAKTGHELSVGGIDLVKGYVLLATAVDGSMRTTAKFTSVRVVCSNTLEMAMQGAGGAIKVSHASVFDEAAVKTDLGLLDGQWQAFGKAAQALAARKISRPQAASALAAGFGDSGKYEAALAGGTAWEAALAEQSNYSGISKILKLFDGAGRGADLKTAKDTAWGLVNAVTEYLDYDYGRDASNRIASSWFGPNAERKQRVLAYLTDQ